jgi:hypothetical protein
MFAVHAERGMTNYGHPSDKDRIDTQESGRICAEDGCGTILSRYNPANRCEVHIGKEPPKPDRVTPPRR